MGKKITKVSNREFKYLFWCPGCNIGHGFNAGEGSPKPVWKFNNNMESPTLSPSYHTWHGGKGADGKWNDKHHVCHSHIKDGKIQFLGDCTHKLKNQIVDLPDFDKAGK